MGRAKIKITLSGEEEKTLRMWIGAGKTEQRMAQRARVILCSAGGLTLPEISERSGLGKQNCSKWRKRFSEAGLDGLKNMKGRGRPRVITPQQRLNVIELASGKPPDRSNRWSVRKLARATGLGVGTVHQILNEGEIKPHKVEYWCGMSPDPEFAEKQAAILGLYLNPSESTRWCCVLTRNRRYRRLTALSRSFP